MEKIFTIKPIPKLRFGAGTLASLPELIRPYGQKLLIVAGRNSFTSSSHWKALEANLAQKGFTYKLVHIDHEPSPDIVNNIVDMSRSSLPDVVVSIGGGSVLDGGKAISAMLKEQEPVEAFLEGVGTKTPSGNKVPFIAVPTTSGTGSEATSNAVISRTGPEGFKKSLRHDNYIPDIAVIDPELTLSCPESVTIACGMDSYTQLVEAYLSTKSTPLTDTLALDGIRHVAEALPQVIATPSDIKARASMAYGAYLSGIVLANAGLGTVHGFASTIGGSFAIPHGVVCGTLMAEANRATLEKLEKENTTSTALQKYTVLGQTVYTGRALTDKEYRETFVNSLIELTARCGMKTLADYGVEDQHLEQLATSSSNKNNPVKFSTSELYSILHSRL